RTGYALAAYARAHRTVAPPGQGAQSFRLYRPCLACRGARRRFGHACRCFEKGHWLGEGESGTSRAFGPPDPLDLRGCASLRAARAKARQSLRDHTARSACLWPRAERREMAALRELARN